MTGTFRLLKLAALVVLVCLPLAAQEAPPDPAAWLRSGPMLGPSEPETATVWLQTRLPVRAQLRFWPQGKPESARVSEEMGTTAEGDLIARFHLIGLQFGTRYDYELYLDGFRVERAYPLTFQTQSPLAHRSARLPGTWVVGVRNFSLLEVSGKTGARVLTLRTMGANGKELWKYEIREAELRVAAKP